MCQYPYIVAVSFNMETRIQEPPSYKNQQAEIASLIIIKARRIAPNTVKTCIQEPPTYKNQQAEIASLIIIKARRIAPNTVKTCI